MSDSTFNNFITGQTLFTAIEAQTGMPPGKFMRRDFVEPLIKFCLDGDFSARIGIVYGLRSTGKTVGMLQAAKELTGRGYKAAYARFNYGTTGIREANAEIIRLAEEGCTHFFIDEAPYLGGFLNGSAEWADSFVPQKRIKIVISGTDSFMLWTAQTMSLFHRYAQFSTNWSSYPEYKRVTGKTYDNYKSDGGILTEEDMTEFIQSAVVDNLIHTIEHCMEDANRTTAYTDILCGISPAVIYKAVISILRCVVEDSVKEHFVSNAARKNIAELGEAISGFTLREKREIKERVAESIELYRNFTPVTRPLDVIETLIEFLVKIGCLNKYITAENELRDNNSFVFAHNALMNFAVEETIRGIEKTGGIDQFAFDQGIRQAAEGALNESVVFAHILRAAKKGDKVFKYRDLENREIDAVIINRETKTLILAEVKSKSRIDDKRIFVNEAKHLFDSEVLKNIGADNSFKVTRALVYRGEPEYIPHLNGALFLVNIEDFLINYKDLEAFFERIFKT